MSQGSPPVLDYDVDAVEPPGWPKAVGITSIVLGAIFVGCIGCSIVGGVIGQSFMPPEMQADPPPSGITPLSMVAFAIGVVCDVVLIIAGAMTVSRRIVGRYLHLLYSALTILAFPLTVWLQMDHNAAMQAYMSRHPEMAKMPGMSFSTGPTALIVGIAIAAVIGLSYPLFLLIWFGLVKKTQQSMTGNVERPMPAA